MSPEIVFYISSPSERPFLAKRLTYIGTMMSNKRDIPPILHKHKEVEQSEFVFCEREKHRRRIFLLARARELALPRIIRRLQNPTGIYSVLNQQMRRYANEASRSSEDQRDSRDTTSETPVATVLRCEKCKETGKPARQAN